MEPPSVILKTPRADIVFSGSLFGFFHELIEPNFLFTSPSEFVSVKEEEKILVRAQVHKIKVLGCCKGRSELIMVR
jgi:hypothetical protein